MAEREIAELKKEIEKIFSEKHIKLDKVVLFGSSARKSANKNSDVDLLFISKAFRNKKLNDIYKMVSGVNRALVNKFDRPFDTIFYSDVDWNLGSSLIVSEAKNNGVVILG